MGVAVKISELYVGFSGKCVATARPPSDILGRGPPGTGGMRSPLTVCGGQPGHSAVHTVGALVLSPLFHQ